MPRCFQYICVILLLCPVLTGCGGGGLPEPGEDTEQRLARFSPLIYGSPDGNHLLKEGEQLRCYSPDWELLWQHGELGIGDSHNTFLVADGSIYNFSPPARMEKLSSEGQMLWAFDTLELRSGEKVAAPLLAASQSVEGGIFMVQHLNSPAGLATLSGTIVTRIGSSGNILWQKSITENRPTLIMPVTDDGLMVTAITTTWNTYRLNAAGVLRLHNPDSDFRALHAIVLPNQQNLVIEGTERELILYTRDWQELWRMDTSPFAKEGANGLFPQASGFVTTTSIARLSAFDLEGEEVWTWSDEEAIADEASVSVDESGNYYITASNYAGSERPDLNFATLYCVSADGQQLWSAGLEEAVSGTVPKRPDLRTNVSAGRVYVSDTYNAWVFDLNGTRLSHHVADEFGVVEKAADSGS